jgi:type VI secretion system protein VasD
MMKLLRWSMVGMLLLGGCGGDDPPPPEAPPPPKIASLTIKAAANTNPNGAGVPSPVVVHVYQLTATTSFAETDFFQLQADAAEALGDELIASEVYVLAPGGVEVYQRELAEDVRFLGVAAGFRDLGSGKWRSFHAVTPAATTLLEADISGSQVNMRKAGL